MLKCLSFVLANRDELISKYGIEAIEAAEDGISNVANKAFTYGLLEGALFTSAGVIIGGAIGYKVFMKHHNKNK